MGWMPGYGQRAELNQVLISDSFWSGVGQERRRFGYRRIHALLRREGTEVNHKHTYRLYRDANLAVGLYGTPGRAGSPTAAELNPLPRRIRAQFQTSGPHRTAPSPPPGKR